MNDDLLKLIQERKSLPQFGRGILIASHFVKSCLECSGNDVCTRYFSKGVNSFNDALVKSASVLTFNDPEQLLIEETKDWSAFDELKEIEKPKNCLLVFKHVLTSIKKDRDGDILHPKGATVDPKMNLLYNHVHTLPIGKMLRVAEHTDKVLKLYSCIIDINDLAQDCAKMVEAGMGRFSHGFRALKFREIKDGSGFEVDEYEVMEESLVSVPSNTDAQTEEILYSMVEGGKLTSSILKSQGQAIKERRKTKSVSVSVPDLANIISKAVVDGITGLGATHDMPASKQDHSCTCGHKAAASTSEKADDGAGDEGEEGTQNKEVKTYSQIVKGALSDELSELQEAQSAKWKGFWPIQDLWWTYCDVYFNGKNTADDLPRLTGLFVNEVADYINTGKTKTAEELQVKFTEAKTPEKKSEENKEPSEMCPDCDCMLEDGTCPKCGYKKPDGAQNMECAMTDFILKSTPDEKERMFEILKGFLNIHRQKSLTEQVKKVIGK